MFSPSIDTIVEQVACYADFASLRVCEQLKEHNNVRVKGLFFFTVTDLICSTCTIFRKVDWKEQNHLVGAKKFKMRFIQSLFANWTRSAFISELLSVTLHFLHFLPCVWLILTISSNEMIYWKFFCVKLRFKSWLTSFSLPSPILASLVVTDSI